MNPPLEADPDGALVARFLEERTDRAFAPLYARHAPRVYGLAIRLLGPLRAQADDAFQETWIRAVQRLSEFEGRSRFSTWLCGIAVNCCREIRRLRGVEGDSAAATGSARGGEGPAAGEPIGSFDPPPLSLLDGSHLDEAW